MNPWITNGIIASVNKKFYYYKQWKKSTSKTTKLGNIELYGRYKKFRKNLNITIKLAKKNYYSKRFDSVKGNIKKTWELINELRGKSKSNIKTQFIIDGKLVEDRREISNGFNIFFSSMAQKMNTKLYSTTLIINNSMENDFKKYLRNRVGNSIFLSESSEEEVFEIINSLENGTASDISILILKKCSRYIF